MRTCNVEKRFRWIVIQIQMIETPIQVEDVELSEEQLKEIVQTPKELEEYIEEEAKQNNRPVLYS